MLSVMTEGQYECFYTHAAPLLF